MTSSDVSGALSDDELQRRLAAERYPRSGKYSARWLVENSMGPHPIWQAEALLAVMPLRPGMRVLDMGCGTALSSVFLAKEFGVQVWATDLWVDATDNLVRITEHGVADRVFPIHAEAHALPFAEGFFDAAVSIGAYHYFGTDSLYVGYFSRFVKPGGQLGFVNPGITDETVPLPPAHIESYWKWDFCGWHSPAWWRANLERSGQVAVEHADLISDGWRDWLRWNEVCDEHCGSSGREAEMLRLDAGRFLGLSRVVARRIGEP